MSNSSSSAESSSSPDSSDSSETSSSSDSSSTPEEKDAIVSVTLYLKDEGTELGNTLDVDYAKTESLDIYAEVLAEGKAPTGVNFSTSNPDIAIIDPIGHITILDLGKVTITATSVFDATNSDSVELNVRRMPMANIDKEGAYTLQAEDCDYSGATDEDAKPEPIKDKDGNETAEMALAGIGYKGAKIVFRVDAQKAATAKLTLRVASTSQSGKGAFSFDEAVHTTINGRRYESDDTVESFPELPAYNGYHEITFKDQGIYLHEGENEIVFEDLHGSSSSDKSRMPNIDYLKLDIASFGTAIEPTEEDPIMNLKGSYILNEGFLEGTIRIPYSDGGFLEYVVTEEMVENFDTTSIGTKKATIKIGEKEIEYTYEVASPEDVLVYAEDKYLFQVEDEKYVDMSGCESTDKSGAVFSSDSPEINDAHGTTCTANISIPGNQIVINFNSLGEGTFDFGMRAQSATNKACADQLLKDVIEIQVNGVETTLTDAILKAGSATNTSWTDLTVWSEVIAAEDLGLRKGVNTIVITMTENCTRSGTVRAPNFDEFWLDVTEYRA